MCKPTPVSPLTNNCKHKREGGDLLVSCSLTSGTVSATLASITLPNSLTIDSARLIAVNTTAANGQRVGWSQGSDVNNLAPVVTATGTSTSLIYFIPISLCENIMSVRHIKALLIEVELLLSML